MAESIPDLPYFQRNHDTLAQRQGELQQEILLMLRPISLFRTLAFFKSTFPNETTFPNDLGGSVCMARASRQLDAAFVLATHGFHSEVRYMIRGVYESAGLGRCLAKNADSSIATKWIEKGDWFPDGKVRTWLGESGVVAEESVGDYRSFYKLASAFAHPTRQSCFDLLRQVGDGLELIAEPEFDLEATRRSIIEISYTALFGCFAFINGVSSESIVPPKWRQELHSIAQELTGEDYAHLNRDWEAEGVRYAQFIAGVRSMEDLQDTLESHPTSVHNIIRETPSNGR